MTTEAAPVAQTPAAPRALSAGLLLVILVVAFESVGLGTVLPRITDELHGLSLYGWASSAFLLSSLLGAVLTGLVSDRKGVAWGAGLCLGLFAVGLLLVGTSQNMLWLVLGRFVEGLGIGGLNALPFVVISAAYRDEAQAKMLAAVSSMWLIPGLIGPQITSALTGAWSWRSVPYSLMVLLLVTAPLCLLPLRSLPRSEGRAMPKRMMWPALALMLAAGLLVEGLRRADLSTALLVPLGLAGIGWSSRSLFPAGLWRLQPGLPASLALRGFAAFAQMGLGSFMTLGLRELHQLGLREVGLIITVGSISWTSGSWIQARIEKQLGPGSRIPRIRWALVAMTAGLVVAALGMLGPLPVWAAYLGWLISGTGMGLAYNSNSLYAMSCEPEQSGQLSGQLANIEVLMVALSAGISGALVARITPLHDALALAFAMNILVSLLAWLAGKRMAQAQG